MNNQELLELSFEANPYYTEARLDGMRIMPARREKYSGEGKDPYTNFKLMYFNLRLMNPTITMKQMFVGFYVGLKYYRLIADDRDFDDDSQSDSVRDGANYSDLYNGALSQRQEERERFGKDCELVPWTWDWISRATENGVGVFRGNI